MFKLVHLGVRFRSADEEDIAFAHVVKMLPAHDDDSFVADGMTQQSFFEQFTRSVRTQKAKVEGAARSFARHLRPFRKFRQTKQVLGFVTKIAAVNLLCDAWAGCHGEKAAKNPTHERMGQNSHNNYE